MKRLLFTALVAIVAIGGAFAETMKSATVQEENIYTYYLEGDCDTPQICSEEFDGQACSIEFSGYRVYDAPSCNDAHEVSVILGKRPIF